MLYIKIMHISIIILNLVASTTAFLINEAVSRPERNANHDFLEDWPLASSSTRAASFSVILHYAVIQFSTHDCTYLNLMKTFHSDGGTLTAANLRCFDWLPAVSTFLSHMSAGVT